MKTFFLTLVFLTLCSLNLMAQRVSYFYQPDPNSTELFLKEWNRYGNAEPKIPLRFTLRNGSECSFDGFGFMGQPQFICSCNNLDAAKTIGTQNLWPGGSIGLNLSGAGLNKLGIWDGGSARISHREFTGRITVMDTPYSISGHTTAVSGNMMASGLNTNAKGMSFQTQLQNWNFTNDNAEIIAAAPNLLLSNHSYASTTAWQQIGNNLYWYGDSAINMFKDWKFGYYDNRSRIWDSVMVQNPFYLMVKACGNDRGSGVAPGSTHYYWNGTAWVLTNTTRDTVGPYDCISTFGTAKNILCIGAVQVLTNGYTGPGSISLLPYSSWGPTDDGRIKPDLVGASGVIISTGSAHDSDYAGLGGTSISSSNVCGSLLLLQQYHYQLKNRYMRNATLKGLAIHTADRCKNNPGPDYECGWGLPNMKRAALCLQDSFRNTILERTLNNNDSFSIDVYVTTGDTLRTTLCWTDPQGITGAPAFNDTTRKLVNDLDLRITNLAGNVLGSPFILNPANPAATATTGDNNKDNIEQIYITNLTTGRYRIKVKHKGQLQNQLTQSYSLLISGSPLYSTSLPVKWLIFYGKQVNWNEVKLNWTTVEEHNNLSFVIEYSFDGANFLEAGKLIESHGNYEGLRQYEYNHVLSSGLPADIFYRIKQVDINGGFTYSKTIKIQIDEYWSINGIYPNPFTQSITIDISCNNPTDITFEVYDIQGRLQYEENKLLTGSQQVLLDLSFLQPGIYILKIKENERNFSIAKKIIKQ